MIKPILYSLLTLLAGCIFFNACQSREELDKARYYINGKTLYASHCQNCHGVQGEGLGKLYPPLTDTSFLFENRDRLACFVKHGITGGLRVAGQDFDTEMPANPGLSDIEIAYILTYIGNSFGNNLGLVRDSLVRVNLLRCSSK